MTDAVKLTTHNRLVTEFLDDAGNVCVAEEACPEGMLWILPDPERAQAEVRERRAQAVGFVCRRQSR